MTTFTTLVSGDLDPDSPITTNLANAWYGNPLAIAEDDASAPAFKGRIKAAQLATSSPISSYALASGQSLFAFASCSFEVTGWGGAGSTTVTINIQHNGVTIGSVSRSYASGDTQKSVTLFGYSTTAATGDIAITSSLSGGGGGLTLSVGVSQLGAIKFVSP